MRGFEQHDRDTRLRNAIERAGAVRAASWEESFEHESTHREARNAKCCQHGARAGNGLHADAGIRRAGDEVNARITHDRRPRIADERVVSSVDQLYNDEVHLVVVGVCVKRA